MEEFEITERKILGFLKKAKQYRRLHNNELYSHVGKITNGVRKIRIIFYDAFKE